MTHPESERFVPVRRPKRFPDVDDWQRWAGPPFPIAVVNPTSSPEVDGVPRPLPTAYVGDRLLVRTSDDLGGSRVDQLDRAAKSLNWELDRTEFDDAENRGLPQRPVRIKPGRGVSTRPPDAWVLLQQARAEAKAMKTGRDDARLSQGERA